MPFGENYRFKPEKLNNLLYKQKLVYLKFSLPENYLGLKEITSAQMKL